MGGSEGPDHRSRVAADLRSGVIRIGQRLRAERPREALSANKLSVLGHLHRLGPSAPGEIAAAEHQHPQSLTRVFAELQLAGLVSRSRSECDGRASVLALTTTGREALARDMAQRDAWLAEALTALTAAEIDLLKIAAALLEQIADRPTGDRVPDSQTA